MRLPPRVWKILRSRRTKIALACSPFALLALALLAYPITAWLGRRSVDRFLESIQEKGYVTNADIHFSSSGSPAENFFLHPAMLAEESGSLVQALQSLEPRPRGLSRRPDKGESALARKADIRTWLKPSPSDESEAASRLLTAIKPSRQRLDELRDALKLPHAAWPIEGPLGNGAEAIQIIVRSQYRLRPVAEFAADEAYLHLALGNSDRAAANVEAMLDCHRLYLSSKPTLVALILSEVLSGKISDMIWEGIVRSSWTDAQLASFDSVLGRINHQAAAISAFRGEAALLEIWAENVRALERHHQGVNFTEGWEADQKIIRGRLLGI
ncbi:hypothetical protein [Luteolibacter luteus]|uniref:Uncharacterized protein n=1 Tax=Luteolibacter luteus TaxID=2728835 RepID=A0A858RKM3_9BACT|nr:hypothetical protein [Luteolibacter luteus]QJE96583.1 hypothetical protein HHL09_12575 [Luteolibacter luteus]